MGRDIIWDTTQTFAWRGWEKSHQPVYPVCRTRFEA